MGVDERTENNLIHLKWDSVQIVTSHMVYSLFFYLPISYLFRHLSALRKYLSRREGRRARRHRISAFERKTSHIEISPCALHTICVNAFVELFNRNCSSTESTSEREVPRGGRSTYDFQKMRREESKATLIDRPAE